MREHVVTKSQEYPLLHVEGNSDMFAVIALLQKRGFLIEKPPKLTTVEVKAHGQVSSLLTAMGIDNNYYKGRAVGFILDADTKDRKRWKSVVKSLRKVGREAPAEPVIDGWIKWDEQLEANIGVWMMPDNQHDGELEDLLLELIPSEKSALFEQVQKCVSGATAIVPELASSNSKALVRTYLAWCAEPGRELGHAIDFGYLNHTSPLADAFVAWFKKLYNVEPTSPQGAV